MCEDPICKRRKSPGKLSNKHIRSDNWERSKHKDCRPYACDCLICQRVSEALGKLSAPIMISEKIVKRMRAMNSDFTAQKWNTRFDFLFDDSKPFEEHSHFRYYHINEFGETVERWISMNQVDEDDPLRLQAKIDYLAIQE